MTDDDVTLSRERRDAIVKAVRAIERQLQEMAGKPAWQVAYVIGTNLAIIEMNVTGLPRATSN